MTVLLAAKLGGAVCIVCCGYGIGSAKISALHRRTVLIADLLHLLELLQANFSYQNNALPVFFARDIAQISFSQLKFSCPTRTEEFYNWKAQFAEQNQLAELLTKGELAAFEIYWSSLGDSNAAQELDRLHYYQIQLQYSQTDAKQKEQQNVRVYRSLSISLAAIIALLLL
ncbi:MAG: hypothetical protein RR075_03670 [Pygmaiobacter sp.]